MLCTFLIIGTWPGDTDRPETIPGKGKGERGGTGIPPPAGPTLNALPAQPKSRFRPFDLIMLIAELVLIYDFDGYVTPERYNLTRFAMVGAEVAAEGLLPGPRSVGRAPFRPTAAAETTDPGYLPNKYKNCIIRFNSEDSPPAERITGFSYHREDRI